MPLLAWQPFYYYDLVNDTEAVRYEGFSGHGSYWFAEALVPAGKSRREQKERILDRIEEAIERGDEPGEVK